MDVREQLIEAQNGVNYVTNLIANHKNEMESWELKEYETVLEDDKNKVEYLTNYINENAEFFA